MRVRLILVPYDSGAFDARMGRGPHAIVQAGLADRLRADGHDVDIKAVRAPESSLSPEIAISFALQRSTADEVAAARSTGAFPIVLSGNCNTAVGTLTALEHHGRERAVCWFDAHADFNTPETTASGFLDGMAVSMIVGDCWTSMTRHESMSPEQILLFGTRDVDTLEQTRITDRGVRSFSRDEIEQQTHFAALDAMSNTLAYVHIDLDVLDPSEGHANSYAAPHGLSLATLQQTVGDIQQRMTLGALAFTAYDPAGDPERRIAHAAIEIAAQIADRSRIA